MRNNVDNLARLTQQLEDARDELEEINTEEQLLEFEQSDFPLVQQLFSLKDPYDKLWNTALNFTVKSEEWLNGTKHDKNPEILYNNMINFRIIYFSMVLGPFLALKAEDIENEVHEMWRTMYKLTKVLSDAAGPKIGAERFKSKIDKFKNHMPLLRTICNPGIRDRHWKQVKR